MSWDTVSVHSAWITQYMGSCHRRSPEQRQYHTAQKERPPCLIFPYTLHGRKNDLSFQQSAPKASIHSRPLSPGQRLAWLSLVYCVFFWLSESAHPFPNVLTIPFMLTILPNSVCRRLLWDLVPCVLYPAVQLRLPSLGSLKMALWPHLLPPVLIRSPPTSSHIQVQILLTLFNP